MGAESGSRTRPAARLRRDPGMAENPLAGRKTQPRGPGGPQPNLAFDQTETYGVVALARRSTISRESINGTAREVAEEVFSTICQNPRSVASRHHPISSTGRRGAARIPARAPPVAVSARIVLAATGSGTRPKTKALDRLSGSLGRDAKLLGCSHLFFFTARLGVAP